MESMAADPKVETGDDAFRVLVQEFADDSEANPFAIEAVDDDCAGRAQRSSAVFCAE